MWGEGAWPGGVERERKRESVTATRQLFRYKSFLFTTDQMPLNTHSFIPYERTDF